MKNKNYRKYYRDDEDEIDFNSPHMFVMWLIAFFISVLVMWSITVFVSFIFNIKTIPFFYFVLIGFCSIGMNIIKNVMMETKIKKSLENVNKFFIYKNPNNTLLMLSLKDDVVVYTSFNTLALHACSMDMLNEPIRYLEYDYIESEIRKDESIRELI
jgi:hypothetical protein